LHLQLHLLWSGWSQLRLWQSEVNEMTVKVEVIEGGIPHNKILVAGLIGSLVLIYLTWLNVLIGTPWFSFFGGLGAVVAIIWGSHTIKTLCSYGIGTGVPSAGMVSLGSGIIAMMFATRYGALTPIVALVIAAIIGIILGYLANNVLNMRIPVMIKSLTELTIVGALALLGFSAMLTGNFTFLGLTTGSVTFLGISLPSYVASYIGGALIATMFMLSAIAIQHPFNATLGPGWKQDRMLMLAAEAGFLSMLVGGVISLALISTGPAILTIIISLIGWWYTYNRYVMLSKRDAASWLDSKQIPEMEGQ
jgi:tetrahydromethanopterin S-methyltransferase subunit C